MRIHHRARRLLLAIALALVLAGCGESTPEAIAFADEAPVLDEPDIDDFSELEQRLIDFHVEWICELERRTFATLDQSDELLDDTLEAARIDRETYDTFVKETLKRQDARDAVLYHHIDRCWPW